MARKQHQMTMSVDGAAADHLMELCRESGQPPERVVGWLVLRATTADLPMAWLTSTPEERALLEMLDGGGNAGRGEPARRVSQSAPSAAAVARAASETRSERGRGRSAGQAAFTAEQRRKAEEWLAQGVGVREVARRLGRSPSTITRLRRKIAS